MGALALTALAERINREHQAALRDATSAIDRARTVGKLLIEAKERCDRGQWESWLGGNCSDISVRTAQRYMDVARHPAIEATSVRDALLKLAPSAKHQPNKTTRVSPPQASESEGKVSRDTPSDPVQISEAPKPLEVAPEPQYDFSNYEPEDDEAYRANIENVMMADDKLNALRAELKQCHREIQALKASRDHYQNEAGVAVRLVKTRDREIERLKRQLSKALARKAA